MRSALSLLAAIGVVSALPPNLIPRSYGVAPPYGTGISKASSTLPSASSLPAYGSSSSIPAYPSSLPSYGSSSSIPTYPSSSSIATYPSSSEPCSSSSMPISSYPHQITTSTRTRHTTETTTSVITKTLTYPVTETKTTFVPCSTQITSHGSTYYSTYLSTKYITYTTTATSTYPAIPTLDNYEPEQCNCPAASYITVTETVYSTPTSINRGGPIETITATLSDGHTTCITITYSASTAAPTHTHKVAPYPHSSGSKTNLPPYQTGGNTHIHSYPTGYSAPPYIPSSSSSSATAYTYYR